MSAASVVLLILALIAGLAIPRSRGLCFERGPSNLAGPTGVILVALAVVAFAVGLTLTRFAKRAGEEVPPAEGFLIVAAIAFVVVYLALLIAHHCPPGN